MVDPRIEEYILDCEDDYEETGNPLFVWSVIYDCHNHGKILPEWCMQYLADTASQILYPEGITLDKGLLSINLQVYAIEKSIKQALGINGNHYKEFYRDVKGSIVFFEVIKRLSGAGTIQEAIQRAAMDLNMGKDTVQKCFYEWKKVWPVSSEVLKHLIDGDIDIDVMTLKPTEREMLRNLLDAYRCFMRRPS